MVAGYFISQLGYRNYRRGWLKGDSFACPFCGREGKLGINPSLDFFHCFRCDAGGKATTLIMEIADLQTDSQLMSFLKDYKYNGYVIQDKILELKQQTTMVLPEGFKLLNQGDSHLAKAARNYIKRRKFDVDELTRKGWGYGTKEPYWGYIIMPYHKDNKVVYFNAREFLNPGAPRYLNPDNLENGLSKSMLLYNEEALYTYDSVYLCEGIFNAQTISDDRSICSAGKHISQYQLNLIIKSPVERIIICLDSDAMKQAIEIAQKLIDYKAVKIITFPDGQDANDLGRKKTLKLIYGTRYLRSSKEVMAFRNNNAQVK